MSAALESFAALGLSAPLVNALAEIGYETPSPIQAACIPALLAGHDVLGEAQTGTGKTAAFALPLLERLDPSQRSPQVLVLTPTRELAIQVAEAFQKYARHLRDFHVLPLYGGQSMVVQLRALARGPQVIVGTPGRVMDHLERESLSLAALRALVLDEADEMLRMGFIEDVEWILEHTPAERQTALFSATMPAPIRRVAHTQMREPREIKIRSATSTVAAITQRYWQVRGTDKIGALTRILEAEESLDAVIIFVRTKTATVELAEKLDARGHAVAALNGDMTQGLRERVIEQLKSGALDVVVATDVAARGIDVPRVSHVINYDIPYDTEAYVHRIGRTGRAGRSGNAILFVAPREIRMLREIERATRQSIAPLSLPTRDEIAGRRVAQFKQQVLEVLQEESLEYFAQVVDSLAAEHAFGMHEIAAALACMAQRERPLQLDADAFPDIQGQAPSRQAGPGRDEAGAGRERREPPEKREQILERRREFADGKFVRYRIEVGRNHGAMPKEIVGAIANEGGIEGRFIGQINLFADFSTVELPAELPAEVLGLIGRARVRAQKLRIRPLAPDEGGPQAKPKSRAPVPRAEGGKAPPARAPRAAASAAPPRAPRPAKKPKDA